MTKLPNEIKTSKFKTSNQTVSLYAEKYLNKKGCYK